MKRKLFVGMLAVVICFSLAACGNSGNTVQDNTNGASTQENTGNVVTDNTGNIIQDDTNNEIKEEEPQEPESVKIDKNSKVTMSDGKSEIEFTLTDVVFQSEVYSNSDNMFASYFPDKEDESYIVAKITIKNVGGDSTGYSVFDDIEVTFDDKFNYRMQQLDLESSVMSAYWSCQPLKSVDIYWVQSVPDEVKSMGCNITFTVGDTIYKY